MIPLPEAQAHVLSSVHRLDAVDVPLSESAGRVLADAVVADALIPPFANSAVDGFAVRSEDATAPGITLRIIGMVAAGASRLPAVGPGEAIRIMTGAPIPPGADAVAMVEQCDVRGDLVGLSEALGSGRNVRAAGDDMAPGDRVLDAGAWIGPGAVGLLATLGRTVVPVVRRPVVGVLSTGDELVDPASTPGPGQIRDSNRPALCALIRERGFDAVDLGCAPDDEAAIEAAILHGVASCDALVTSGGVSMGDYDYVKVVLDRIGDMRWMQIAIRPAKPFAFGVIAHGGRSVPVFGLPGNPVSSLVSFELLAAPALRSMAGRADVASLVVPAVASAPLRRRRDGKTHFARVALDRSGTELVATAASQQGSHHMAAMARADGLAVLPDGDGVESGERVEVVLLRSY